MEGMWVGLEPASDGSWGLRIVSINDRLQCDCVAD